MLDQHEEVGHRQASPQAAVGKKREKLGTAKREVISRSEHCLEIAAYL